MSDLPACMTAFRSGLAGKSCNSSFLGTFQKMNEAGDSALSTWSMNLLWAEVSRCCDEMQACHFLQVRLLSRVPVLHYRRISHAVVAQSTPDVEFPPYSILSKGAAYDLRFYDVYKAVRMPYERRDEGKLQYSPSD